MISLYYFVLLFWSWLWSSYSSSISWLWYSFNWSRSLYYMLWSSTSWPCCLFVTSWNLHLLGPLPDCDFHLASHGPFSIGCDLHLFGHVVYLLQVEIFIFLVMLSVCYKLWSSYSSIPNHDFHLHVHELDCFHGLDLDLLLFLLTIFIFMVMILIFLWFLFSSFFCSWWRASSSLWLWY